MRYEVRRKKKKLRLWVKVTMMLMITIGSALVGYTFLSEVQAKDSEKLGTPQMLAGVDLVKESKVPPKKYNGKSRKIVYLTIDDGPSAKTAELLNILDSKKVKATFFLIGNNIPGNEGIIKEMEVKGHYVGMHSMDHVYSQLYTKQQLVPQMIQVQTMLNDILGHRPTLIRPPYGSMPGMTVQIRKQVADAGLKSWDWTIDSNDWKYQKNPNQITAEVMKQLNRSLEVLLIHDKPGTIQALPQIIDAIIAKGYEFEVYSERNHFPLNFWHDKTL